MNLYTYNNITGEFIRETIATINLEQSRATGKIVYNVPTNSTQSKPPFVGKNETCVFKDGKWVIEKDFRGKKYFDTENKKTVYMIDIGGIPESYVELGSQEYYEYLKNTDKNCIRNNLKLKIEELYNNSLNETFLIGKYLFTLNEFEKYKQVKETVVKTIYEINEKIDKLSENIEKETNIEKKNKLIEKQLDVYNDLDNLAVKLNVKNKRKKEIEITCTYKEFAKMYNQLCQFKNKLEENKEKEINNLRLTKDEDLILYEQRLCRRGITFNEETTNEKDTKVNSKTS